jgi:putative transposase
MVDRMYTSAGRPYRRSVRLQDFTYRGATYFVTICTYRRECTLGETSGDIVNLSPTGQIVDEEWRRTAVIRPDVILDDYVVMPNHMHALLYIPRLADAPANVRSLGSLIGAFKGEVTRRVRREISAGAEVWHRNYYEHVVRSQHELDRFRRYIAENPSRWAFDRDNPELRARRGAPVPPSAVTLRLTSA